MELNEVGRDERGQVVETTQGEVGLSKDEVHSRGFKSIIAQRQMFVFLREPREQIPLAAKAGLAAGLSMPRRSANPPLPPSAIKTWFRAIA